MYIDPNSGGMIFQILAIAFGLFSASILIFSSRIRGAFAKLRRKARGQAGPESQAPVQNDETQHPEA